MGRNLLPLDGEAVLEESWLGREQADDLMRQLVDGLDWQQEHQAGGGWPAGQTHFPSDS